jgi:hypothetical protein
MDALKLAATRILEALDLPGPHAPSSVAARLQSIAMTYDARLSLVDAEQLLRAAVEGRPVIVSPWREPGMSVREKFLALAGTFPSLVHCPDMREFATNPAVWQNAEVVLSRIHTGMYGAGKGHAATFMLSLFRRLEWPTFSAPEAMMKWDPAHRAAFVAWANDPWWP